MKEWWAVPELMSLPGMPSTPQGVRFKANTEQWQSRPRQGRGGGKEYHISSLPAETKTTLHFRENANLPEPINPSCKAVITKKEEPAQDLTSLKNWQRKVFDARVALFREFEHLQKLHGTNKAVEVLVDMAMEGRLPEPLQSCVADANARPGHGRALSRSMVLGWQRAVRRHGIAGLAPAALEKNEAPEWAPYFMRCYQIPSNPSIPEAMEAMEKQLPGGMAMPSYYQVVRWHNKRSRLDQEKGRRTGSAYQALKGYRKRDTSGYRPLTIAQCDGHSYKAYVAHPVTGKPYHPEVCAVLDVATRVAVGWSAGLAESALTVAAAIRHAATVNEQKPYGGIFDILYTDGGSGNKAKINADDTTGLFARIGTTFETGRPGNPQGRGLIEKSNQSIWIRAAKRLPAYTGKSMDQGARRNMYLAIQRDFKNKGYSEHLLSWKQFQEYCQEAVDDYNNRPHSALPKLTDPETGRKRHMSPLECWAWHVADGWKPEEHQLSETEVEVLWLPREERVVQRATVSLGKNHYYNSKLAHYDGHKVQVAYYPTDASRVQIWDMEGRLVCYAEYEKNLVDMFPKTMVEQAQERRTKARAAIKEQQLREIYDEKRGVVEIISRAGHSAKITVLQPDRATIEQARKQLEQELSKPAEFSLPDNDRDMVRLWHELDRRVEDGEQLEDRALRFYESFPNSDTFRVFAEVERELSIQAR